MNKYMAIAVEEAKKGISLRYGGPFGAVIVKNGKVISKGHNKVLKNNDSTCHGEIDAIRKAEKKLKTYDLTGCEIYTTGYPCPMCFCAILWANISKVYYGCNTTDTELIGFRDKAFEESIETKKITICREIDRKDCLELYKEYNDMEKTIY